MLILHLQDLFMVFANATRKLDSKMKINESFQLIQLDYIN